MDSVLGKGLLVMGLLAAEPVHVAAHAEEHGDRHGAPAASQFAASQFASLAAPAGERPAATAVQIDGRDGAILPNGRFVTPEGTEINVTAPKPFGLAMSPDGDTVATLNSGASRFSITLIRNARSSAPQATRIDVDATFMGIVFSPDGKRFYASGGDNGNLWIGDVATARIVGSVNLNGPGHPLDRPLTPSTTPTKRFKGAFPGNMSLSRDGRHLYVVDQGSFAVHVVDTSKIFVGTNDAGAVTEPDNFAAVVGRAPVGRYPFGIALDQDDDQLFVTHVGIFQYAHLRPANPTGDNNVDYPLCLPAVGYPDEVETPKTVKIKKIDASKVSGLPTSLRDPEGIRCGYVPHDLTFTVPALGSPNAKEASSVYSIDVRDPANPKVTGITKTGVPVGEKEAGVAAYGGSHPNAVVLDGETIYVSNGNNDTISVLRRRDQRVVNEISLTAFEGADRPIKGVEPVALALDRAHDLLYVAEAGINAIAVVDVRDSLNKGHGRVLGHVPAGWWPSALSLTRDGKTLYVANAKGRGAGPNVSDSGPKHSTYGTVQVVSVPLSPHALQASTQRVLRNNGLRPEARLAHGPACNGGEHFPVPEVAGIPSRQIKHVVFINKENATHDLLLGDITATREGKPVNGDPAYFLGPTAAPNHHALALGFAFGDNFYLEPTVSSDGHRWLTNTYTTEFEETHWPASYGGKRRDSGDDPEVIAQYPGRIGFTDADGSPDPEDFNQRGTIYAHLVRHGLDFVNFGNGFEFALVDEDRGTEPTGIREHANVPMEKIVRDRTDHLFPEFNTAIPDAPLPENPDRFNRFGRFKQVFESHYVDRSKGECRLPAYVDLYYPNDHGGGANDINPNGPAWDYTRYVQDNDAALGLTVDLLSKSPCWKDTVIFVVEDDTQNGLDHVDGYRSLFLAISPWVKRQQVTKTHLSLASIFKTIDLIFGMEPLNQYDAAATDLRSMFTSEPDFRPYDYQVPAFVAQAKPLWKKLTRSIDFGRPDSNEALLRHAIARSEGLPHRTHHKTTTSVRGSLHTGQGIARKQKRDDHESAEAAIGSR